MRRQSRSCSPLRLAIHALPLLLLTLLPGMATHGARAATAPAATDTLAPPKPLDANEQYCAAVLPPGPRSSGATGSDTKPKPAVPPHTDATTILYDGFEGVFPNTLWSVSGDPTWDDHDCANPAPYAGTWSLWCASGGNSGRDPDQYYYANNMNAWAIYGPFSLADASAGSLSFFLWNKSELNADYFQYMVSINGTNFYGQQHSGNSGGWTARSLDFTNIFTLGNICGRPQVWIAFIFASDSSVVDEGAFVDEVRIEKTASPARFDLVALDVFPGDAAGNELPKPYTITVGQSISLCLRYRCDGVGPTPSFRREIWLDGQRLGTYDGITTGGQTRTTRWAWTATAGSHNLEGRLDTANAISETNEGNNVRTESPCFTVGGGSPVIRIVPASLSFNLTTGQPSPAPGAAAKREAGFSPAKRPELAQAERLGDGRRLVWVTPSGQAEPAALQQAVAAQGGAVLSLAPEGKLLVALSATQAPALAAAAGVAAVEPYVVKDLGGDPNAGHAPGLGERPPTPDEEQYIRAAYTPVDRLEPEALSVQRARLQGLDAVPAAVDNAPSQYFPPIRSQGGQGSCTCWAACYYYDTYTQAHDENLTVSGGDNSKICTPAFMYPLINGGTDAGGSTPFVVARLNQVGCCNWNLKPYLDTDWVSWPTEAAWVEALKRRTLASHSFDLTTDPGIAALKQHLANGNIAATRTDVYTNWWPTFKNNQGVGIENGVLFSHAGASYGGGHAMTIVGYDDNRAYNNGSTTRYGAFLIANSWGAGWGTYNSTGTGSKGFMWVAYDYVKAANNCFDTGYYNDDRASYRSRLYAVTGLNHVARGYVSYWGGVGSPTTPAWTSYRTVDRDGGTSQVVTDAKRIAVDLTEGTGSIADLNNVSLFVKCSVSNSASGNATLTSAQFYHDFDHDGSFLDVSSTDPTVTVVPGQTGVARVTFAASANSRSFTVFNDGNGDLRLTRIDGRDGDPWLSWLPNPSGASPVIIPPGGARSVTVYVDPRRAHTGRNDEQLFVYSNDADKSPCPNAVFVSVGSGPYSAARKWELYR